MKYILSIFFFLFISANAESIYNGYCVSNFYTKNSASIFIEYSHGTSTITNYSDSKIQSLVNNQGKFYYDSTNNFCNAYIDSNYFGLTYNQYNFVLAIWGVMISSLIAFGFIKAF